MYRKTEQRVGTGEPAPTDIPKKNMRVNHEPKGTSTLDQESNRIEKPQLNSRIS